jgi:hypothetical protein
MRKFTKGGTDGIILMNVREGIIQRFEATDWLDLRIGFLVSITNISADDVITSNMTETILGSGSLSLLGFYDRYHFGVVDNTGVTGISYTNRGNLNNVTTPGNSILTSSDSGIGGGTFPGVFWRPHNSVDPNWSFQVYEANQTRRQSHDGAQIHLAQNSGSAGGYATLLMMRLRRDNVTTRAKIITVQFKSDPVAHNGDVLYTNDPSKLLLQANLEAFPANVETFDSVELLNVPNCFIWYWPFHNSRLRMHAAGILKVIV